MVDRKNQLAEVILKHQETCESCGRILFTGEKVIEGWTVVGSVFFHKGCLSKEESKKVIKLVFKKEFIVEARNTGKIFGLDILKINLSDEHFTGNYSVNCNVALSDKKGLGIKKGDKFKIIIEKLD